MVATLKVYVDFGGSNGAPGTTQDTSALGPPNVRLKTADDATIDLVNPIPIPASGTNYSFWKNCVIKCSVAPNTQVNNLKIYTGGSDFGTGIITSIGNQFPAHTHLVTTGYFVGVGTVGTTGTELITGYTGITSKSNLFSYTSGAPLTGPSIGETGGNIVNIGDTSNYFVIQTAIGTTASPGLQAQQTITLQYDEI
jgi:hypothetical protein